MNPFAPHHIPDLTRAEIVELIRSIQSGDGGRAEFQALERASKNPDVWIIFDVLELEGMAPNKIYDLFCAKA